MNFNIDIHTNLLGDITIEDFSKDYGYYMPEGNDYPDALIVEIDGESTLKYKYSKTVSMNILVKMSIDTISLKEVIIHKHDLDDEVCNFHVEEDGYYILQHLVLPTKEWFDSYLTTDDSELDAFISGGIYFIDDETIYKVVNNELQEASVRELLERNYESTTILNCKIDVFYNGNLQQCYINYCKKLYDALLNKCKPTNYDEDIYARDFIWMTLNIIDYLIGFKLFMEAQRIIELTDSCGGFCKSIPNKLIGCGCSKA